jgi:hypothetical protein
MERTLSSIQKCPAFERWAHHAEICLLAVMLSACAGQSAASRLDKPSPESTLLDQLAALTRADMTRIDLDVLSTLADADIRALVQAHQNGATTSDGTVSVTKGIAKPGEAVIAVTYRLASAGPAAGGGRHTTEQAILILNPLIACVTDKAIQQQWGQAVQSGRLGELRYGPGYLWPMDGLRRNKDEQAKRGNGPIEVIVPVMAPSSQRHTSSFRFTYEYWHCARSVVLERVIELARAEALTSDGMAEKTAANENLLRKAA